MKLSKENGFDFDGLIRLDDKSIKALYPEFFLNTDYQKLSPTYLKWKKENEETGITQLHFIFKYGFGTQSNFYQICKKEAEKICKKQYEELQRRFDAFVKEHKDEIYKAQIEAIKASENENKKRKEEMEKENELKRKNARFEYERGLIQYRNGSDIALSTLKEKNNLDLINQLLILGYSVKCASASIVFLTWEHKEKPSMTELEKIFPFEYEEPDVRRFFSIRCTTEPVCGVVIDSCYHLLGYEYPKEENIILSAY
jgi:hypothetical protein